MTVLCSRALGKTGIGKSLAASGGLSVILSMQVSSDEAATKKWHVLDCCQLYAWRAKHTCVG